MSVPNVLSLVPGGVRWQIETVRLGNTFIEGSESGTSRGQVVV